MSMQQHFAFPSQDRLIRKEVALGTLREQEPPQNHIGLQLVPMESVPTDDVIFDYMKGLTDGLAPARAEDAEAELAQKDEQFVGIGRAAVIDWSLKDHYSASDVSRYQEWLLLQQRLGANASTAFPLTIMGPGEAFQQKLAKDAALRKKKLDNRLEWLIWTSFETSGVAYNDGKIRFSIDWGRPADQTDEAPLGGTFNLTTADPIGAFLSMQEFMFDKYGVRMTRAFCSRKVLNSFMNSDRFIARSGMVGATGSAPVDPNYIMDGWGPQAAQAVVERQTGITFTAYDAVYRTRPIGSNTVTNNRFFNEKKILFLPDAGDVDALDDAIGFAKTLTSPHPEGGWASGFYEWEQTTTDPWGVNRGTGIKAFPVFPHMDLTYTMTVLP